MRSIITVLAAATLMPPSPCDATDAYDASSPCPVPVVLDDFAGGASSTGWSEGWYQPCGDAYGSHQPVDFHHDNAESKGDVSVEYVAENLRAGCWLVEEHHPGENPLCCASQKSCHLPHRPFEL